MDSKTTSANNRQEGNREKYEPVAKPEFWLPNFDPAPTPRGERDLGGQVLSTMEFPQKGEGSSEETEEEPLKLGEIKDEKREQLYVGEPWGEQKESSSKEERFSSQGQNFDFQSARQEELAEGGEEIETVKKAAPNSSRDSDKLDKEWYETMRTQTEKHKKDPWMIVEMLKDYQKKFLLQRYGRKLGKEDLMADLQGGKS